MVPIWRLDDGPVYGIPWELCQGAQRHSDLVVSMGFPASWADLSCANVSYAGPQRSYSQTVPVTQGSHTLWTGTLIMTSVDGYSNWGQGNIKIDQIMDPVFPKPVDPRFALNQFPGCAALSSCLYRGQENCCPRGIR